MHTDEPDAATGLFERDGHAVSTSTSLTWLSRSSSATPRWRETEYFYISCGGTAPRAGGGDRRRFQGAVCGLGAAVLDGGPTLNPSTYDLLAGIHAVPAEEVVVLPNSSNVFMAAERAADLQTRT